MRMVASLTAFAAVLLSALPAAAGPPPVAPVATTQVAYVVLGPQGQRIARVLVSRPACPLLRLDRLTVQMTVRAPAAPVPLRTTRSPPAESRPSVFAETVCEAVIPPAVRRATVIDHAYSRELPPMPLPLPPARISRIVVIGDTGCRLKSAPGGGGDFQACNDPAAYPFARVAAAAARWKPDLVVHVGDYHYRENICPETNAGCAGSPWGYGSDAWAADFFEPAKPLLAAAAWAPVRGNHESCNRGGQGWMRYLDALPATPARSCNDPANDVTGDYTDPYAVPLGGATQLLMFDSSNAPFGALAPTDVRSQRYRADFERLQVLAGQARYNIFVDHHPLLNLGAFQPNPQTPPVFSGGNPGLLGVFGQVSPRYVPQRTNLVLSGHVHLWQAISFSSDHPAQLVAGFSGTQEDTVPLPATPPPGFSTAPGAVIEAMSSWIDGFGFMTLTRAGNDRWKAEVRDVDGKVVNTCRITGRKVSCKVAQVRVP